MTAPVRWLSCGVLQRELEALLASGDISGELVVLDSMLHIHPIELEQELTTILKQRQPENPLVLVYGDCSPGMLDLCRAHGISRTPCINCAQMLTGTERYRELMKNGTFLLLPEWTLRWREVFEHELGLSENTARSLMREHRSELVYLDTGMVPIPTAELVECSDFTGLPWRIEACGLDHLKHFLEKAAMKALNNKPQSTEYNQP